MPEKLETNGVLELMIISGAVEPIWLRSVDGFQDPNEDFRVWFLSRTDRMAPICFVSSKNQTARKNSVSTYL